MLRAGALLELGLMVTKRVAFAVRRDRAQF